MKYSIADSEQTSSRRKGDLLWMRPVERVIPGIAGWKVGEASFALVDEIAEPECAQPPAANVPRVRRQGAVVAISVAVALAGCGSPPDAEVTAGASGTADASTATSAAPAKPAPPLVTAPRAGWAIGLPDGWVAVNRDELRALDEASVNSLATRMNVEVAFLKGFVGLEPFEAYAADPVNPREMRVVFSAQRMLVSQGEVEALIEPFNGSVDSTTSMSTPAGKLAVSFFEAGEAARPSYGAVFIGNGRDKVSTVVVYVFAESPGALAALVQEVAPKMEIS